MVIERADRKGLIANGARGLVQHVAPSPDLRPLKESGVLVNDIFRFSGLSDEEIARALGLTQNQLLAFRNGLATNQEKTTAVARNFLRRNMIEAAVRSPEEVAEWWRTKKEDGTRLDRWVSNLSLRK